MGLTFGEIKRLVAPYAGRAGKCPTASGVDLFARQVMEYLLYSGDRAGERKVCILAQQGRVTMPPEVELPIKARIDHRVAEVWSKWCSFHSTSEGFERCSAATEIMAEDGSVSPLAYALPRGGSQIGVLAICSEADDAFVLVQGKDPSGRPIHTSCQGETIPGEQFKLVKGQTRYGRVVFGQVTAITKSKTNGYVVLYAIDPVAQTQQFLADYAPTEEKPLYRVYRILSRDCPPLCHVSMLCRVKLKENYHDNEVTFFENSLAITLAAQRINSEVINDVNTANYKRQATEDILEKEAGYKKLSGGPVDVFHPLSGGAIKNIV